MKVHGFHHVNMRVGADVIGALADFYCKVIGLTVGWRPPFSSKGLWLYAGEIPVVHLVEDESSAASTMEGWIADRAKPPIDHVALRCSGPEEFIARLRDFGIPYAISEVPEVGDLQILIHDPLGTGIELSFSKE